VTSAAAQPTRATTPAAAPQATPPPARAAAPAPPDPRFDTSDANVNITVTITDKNGAKSQTKVVSLIVANGESGRVRSTGVNSGGPGTASRNSDLNVDASARLMKSGLIRTFVTINYQPEGSDEQTRLTSVTQQAGLYLKDGQSTVITQAADPTTGNRSVTVEVTAKIIR
jgi:hypothetical protein